MTGNVPVFETLEIIDKDLFLTGGVEFDFAFFEVFDGGFSKAFHVDEPLRFEHRLNDSATFVTVGDRVGDFFFAAHKALFFKIFQDLFAGFKSGETTIGFGDVGVHSAVFGDNRDALQIVTLANFEIVEIVGGGDFDGAGAVFGVGVLVGDDGDFTVGEREFNKATNEVLIARVIGVDGDGGITEKGFGASGTDDNFGVFDIGVIVGAAIGGGDDLIGNIPEVTRFVLVFDFDVCESSLVVRAEIDEFFATVNHAVIPHFFKSFVDARDDVLIKGESEIIPSTRGTKSTKLEFHIATLLLDEVPDTGVKFVAGIFKAGVTFFFECAFVDDPGFEASVIGARDIPSIFAAETVVASEGIFEGDGEAVTDVKIAVGVGGWHNKRVAIISIGFIGVDDFWRIKGAGMFPFGVDLGLESTWFVAFGEFHRYIIS